MWLHRYLRLIGWVSGARDFAATLVDRHARRIVARHRLPAALDSGVGAARESERRLASIDSFCCPPL